LELPVIPSGIEKSHIESALREIDKNGVPADRKATKFYLLHAGRRYPPKYSISLAARFASGTELDPEEFSGGAETNSFLRSFGFEIEAKQTPSISELLETILQDFPAARNSGQFGKENEIWAIFLELEKSLAKTQLFQIFPTLRLKWSVGQGNWAKIPWVAFLDTRETTTTQRGVYCVFLFRQDSSGVYLTLNQGVTEPLEKMGSIEGRSFLRSNAAEIREKQKELATCGFLIDDTIDLRTTLGLGSEYEASTICHKLYERGAIPGDEQIKEDLEMILGEYSKYLNNKNPGSTWIFQASPQFYDIEGALRDLKQQTWTISQFKEKIHSGDRVLVWESGQEAGILAIATVLTEPAMINFPKQENPYVRDANKFEGPHLAVTIRTERILLERLSKKQMLGDAILKNLSIIKNPRGTNFEVTSEQSRRISELLQKDHPSVIDSGGTAMSIDRNFILYGPPGTGKTYWTMRKAVEICDGVAVGKDVSIQQRYKELCENNRIEFVTFHQSYGYEDFIEGIRPILLKTADDNVLDSNVIKYECRDGAFKRICSFAMSSGLHTDHGVPLDLNQQRVWKMSLGDTSRTDDAEIYEQCIENSQIRLGYGSGLDFTGCDDRQAIAKKRMEADESIKEGDFSIDAVNRFKNEMRISDLVVISDGNLAFRAIGRVTGTYSALPEGTEYRQMRPVQWLLVLEKSLPVERILTKIFSQATIYQLREPVLRLDALRELLSGEAKSKKNYVLIIDEINRGNITKTFGELITLLEADKRLGADNEIKVTLPYSGEKFGVPENLFILGTMNTADRSIAFLDAALRRRFHFEEMMPNVEIVRHKVGQNGIVDSIDVAALLDQVNRRIEQLFDRDHQIGHAYFLGIKSVRDLMKAFRSHVIPLLQEYFYADWAKICVVLGCPHDATTGKPLTKNPLPLVTVSPSDAIDADMVDGVEPKFRYEINPKLSLESIDLIECFRWVSGIPKSAPPLNSLESPEI
jgi:5-methylcytosine-specific restriction enzyme B